MLIIGCDFHPSWEQVSWLDPETGETGERKLVHAEGEAERFYRELPAPALVTRERISTSLWRWISSCLRSRCSRSGTHSRGNRPSTSSFRMCAASRLKNGLQHLALNQGMQRKGRLWSRAGLEGLRQLPLAPWAARRRQDLLALLDALDQQIAPLDRAVAEAAEQNGSARLLMTQPGVGPITALAFVLTLGEVSRFPRGKQVASYLGLIPREHSSAGRQKLGSITKQGNRMLRMLLVEAAQGAVRYDPEFRREYQHRCHSKPKAVAKVAAARKLAVRLYWMLRTQTAYPEIVRIESSPRVALAVPPQAG